ncbi:hypothetical protein [Neisseria sp. HMSC70E02]|jgi:hypothetical protein|uniref:hypothetical protein n=1 Tax=Neisseria sp. HMSC70E02 TaxID=1608896 RepID=UPI0008A976F5|nr:hypothetical protein [Neisseria sp. HMSC70E02]OHR75353.1 hypothetical protein HMPREF3277_06950 [Neisseria sp. HMSC70E02]
MNRFFKAYFISSLIYAVVFGLLVYSVGLLFSGFECFDIDADNEQYAEYCSRAHEMSAFEKVSLKFFFFPFLSVMLLSLLNAGIMKWAKRCTTSMTLALPIVEWLIVWFVFLLWKWSSLDSSWTAITGLLFFGLPVYGMTAVQALSVLVSSANANQKI